ncbi:MAG: LamG-like jellyroll fold domain-containing protein, partial [Anaerolineales bacterium]
LSQCPSGLGGNCMGQWESHDMAYDRYTWDEILQYFYANTVISGVYPVPGGWSLRYEGNGYADLDRVKILLDGPARPIDVGASDFTLEWWIKALPGENGTAACVPGGDNWIRGNTLLDRDVFGAGDYGDYGISLAGGRLAFGVHNGTEAHTMCGSARLDDGTWHHVAVTRRAADGWLTIFVDGTLDVEGDGPDGDLSYRDGRTSTYSNDPFLVIGAEKHDTDRLLYPSFRGWIDEVRVSAGLRYAAPFPTPAASFSPDADTMALYHFDRGFGDAIEDSAGAAGGPSAGLREYGGVENGPEWTSNSPWYVAPTAMPTLNWPTPTATPTRTPTRTPTSTQTPVASSATPSPTPTDTPATSVTLTYTPTTIASETPTATPTATSSGAPTSAPSLTPTPAFSATPTGETQAGDLNLDGGADVVDLQLCVNVVLGIETSPDIVSRADLNEDGAVNVLDVQALVNIILAA